MAILKPLINLIRLPNLLIIVITQGLVFYGIITPALNRYGIQSEMDGTGFFILLIITILTTLGGYLINDLQDVEIDRLNKPEKQVVGKYLSIQLTRFLYLVLLVLGITFSLYFWWYFGTYALLLIFLVSAALLALYSYLFKGTVLLGNILVSALSAFVVVILIFFEQDALEMISNFSSLAENTIYSLLVAFIVFAFTCSLVREIVKDLEDLEGDQSAGVRTTAVILGRQRSKMLGLSAGLLLLACLIYWFFHPLNEMNHLLRWYAAFLSLYNLWILYKLWQAQVKEDFTRISRSLKWMMAAGLIYLFLYSYIFYL